jgi:hypothetical protein
MSPAWPALVLLITRSLVPAFAGARRRSDWLLAVPTACVLVLTAYSIYNINGLGSTGWQALRAGGLSGLGNAALMRNIAYGGDFDAEYAALAPQVLPTDSILTNDGRLRFFYLNQADVQQPQGCQQLPRHRLFVMLEDDEVRTIYGKLADPTFWEACPNAQLTKAAERPGAFALFINQQPNPCGGYTQQDQGLAIEFGRWSSPDVATALQKHVASIGFVQARVEQLGCHLYRVVETGIPSKAVGDSIVAEAAKAGLKVKLVNGTG